MSFGGLTNMFTLTTVSPNNLKVETPFPVTYPVWDLFVFNIFPEFMIPGNYPSQLASIPKSKRGLEIHLSGDAKIFHGEQGYRWNHAYLPADARTGLGVSTMGYIYVPENMGGYLAALIEMFRDEGRMTQELKRSNERQTEALKELFAIFQKEISAQYRSSSGFRDAFYRTINQCSIGGSGVQVMVSAVRQEFISTLDKVINSIEKPRQFIFPRERITEGMISSYRHIF